MTGASDETGTPDGEEAGPPDATNGDIAHEESPEDTHDPEPDDVEELRAAVEEKYDFENFGPADMAEMTLEEWQVAFDPETWITGEALLDRVEDDLNARVADREVFARVERHEEPPRVVAYSDEGYAVVYPNGSVQGEGTVLRDVKPSVALCSMESYDVPEPPADAGLPEPESVPEQSGELGNLVLQFIAGAQVLAAVVLLVMGVISFGTTGANAVLLFVAGLGFLAVGLLLFFVVANARLSDAYRAEEYRNRLRAVGVEDGERPDFLPPAAGGEVSASGADASGASAGGEPPPNGSDTSDEPSASGADTGDDADDA